jgi:ethanolamine ammonia-lyase small subunit
MSQSEHLWDELKRLTPARLGLGRVGASLPTAPWLQFCLAHAAARDAVHATVDWQELSSDLKGNGSEGIFRVASAVSDRAMYLRRPDLGRMLDDASLALLTGASEARTKAPAVVWVFADGLSALALQAHAVPLYQAVTTLRPDFAGPVVCAQNARVALGDAIGAIFSAEFVVVAIGERPGLSSPDSLGLYLTRAPQRGRSDAERNCLSNVREAGISYAVAARKLCALIDGARRLGATGTRLKDETGSDGLLLAAPRSAPGLAGKDAPAS